MISLKVTGEDEVFSPKVGVRVDLDLAQRGNVEWRKN